jgi:hypothetical protein
MRVFKVIVGGKNFLKTTFLSSILDLFFWPNIITQCSDEESKEIPVVRDENSNSHRRRKISFSLSFSS